MRIANAAVVWAEVDHWAMPLEALATDTVTRKWHLWPLLCARVAGRVVQRPPSGVVLK